MSTLSNGAHPSLDLAVLAQAVDQCADRADDGLLCAAGQFGADREADLDAVLADVAGTQRDFDVLAAGRRASGAVRAGPCGRLDRCQGRYSTVPDFAARGEQIALGFEGQHDRMPRLARPRRFHAQRRAEQEAVRDNDVSPSEDERALAPFHFLQAGGDQVVVEDFAPDATQLDAVAHRKGARQGPQG